LASSSRFLNRYAFATGNNSWAAWSINDNDFSWKQEYTSWNYGCTYEATNGYGRRWIWMTRQEYINSRAGSLDPVNMNGSESNYGGFSSC
jgi:hypothetical protein